MVGRAKVSNVSKVNILFTCVGRRAALVEDFRSAAVKLSLPGIVMGTDVNPLSPALYVCDRHVINKPISHRRYVPELLALAGRKKISLLIPTIDTELKALAANRDSFLAVGTRVLISSPDVISLCQDKRKTYSFLTDNGFGTPETWIAEKVCASKLSFPVFLKPWDGSASKGNVVARDADELRYWCGRIPNCLVQEHIRGQEYTCDVYVDFNMHVRCVVPRKRIAVRAGEVCTGKTVKIPKLMHECKRLVETLGAGPGVITIQCFLTPRGKIKFIEVNPRLGGGVPLSIKAGADFPKWILQELTGRRPRIGFDRWKDGLYMLRYDQAVWRTPDPKSVRSQQ